MRTIYQRGSRQWLNNLINLARQPVASSVSITGTTTAGQTLTGHYTYTDPEGDAEGTSTFRWLRSGVAIGGATSITYALVAADIGSTIIFEVTPVSSVYPYAGSAVQSSATAAIAGRAPTASSVSITGTTTEGETLTGHYTYADADSDAEGTSTFRWLRSDVAIGGATSITYVLQAADVGTTIKFEVTPVSVAAPTGGTPVQSSATATIAASFTPTAVDATRFYTSPGGPGDYLDSSTSIAPLLIFPGTTESPWTIAMWTKRTAATASEELMLSVSAAGSPPSLRVVISDPANDDYSLLQIGDGASPNELVESPGPDRSSYVYECVTFDGATVRLYRGGSLVGTVDGNPDPFAWPNAADLFVLGADYDHSGPVDCIYRNILVNDRCHTALEVSDLNAAGPTHNALTATGTHWAGSQSIPVYWCSAAVAGEVGNSGDGGACSLVLHGSVTSETDP